MEGAPVVCERIRSRDWPPHNDTPMGLLVLCSHCNLALLHRTIHHSLTMVCHRTGTIELVSL